MPKILQPAGFWRRVTAHLIDELILFLILFIPLFTYLLSTDDESFLDKFGFPLGIAADIMILTYYASFIAGPWQATPGKRIMEVYVVDADNLGRINWSRSAARYLVCFLPLILASQYEDYNDRVKAYEIPSAEIDKCIQFQPEPKVHLYSLRSLCKEKILSEKLNALNADVKANPLKKDSEYAKSLYQARDEWMEINHPYQNTQEKIELILNLLALIYVTILCFKIGWNEEKIGYHDITCKTRAVRGKPR